MRTHCWFLLCAVLITTLGGCQRIDYTTSARYQQGLVVCLGGAGGITGDVDRIRQGLHQAHVPYALEDFSWSRHDVLDDQTNIAENRLWADRLTRRIQAYRCDYPSRPVYLIGVSAGTGILVWSLEALHPSQCVDGAVLVASSLDAGYDLTEALEHIAGRMHSFYSLTDPMLSLGTSLAGTVDRRHGFSGGLAGFNLPKDADQHTRGLYARKLTQRGWNPADVLEGHIGDHLGATNPAFVRRRIAPLLMAKSSQRPQP